MTVSLNDIETAAARLAGRVRHTPCLRFDALDGVLGCRVYGKPESLQLTGSFKVRGATNRILSLSEKEKARGIIASSSGNHAMGVAYAARMLGIKATLVLPENAPKYKIEGTRALGAEVVLHGFDSIQRYKKLHEIQAQKGYTLVHSYDDPQLIAGQGTTGYEIVKDLPDVEVVVIPLGGGGLLAGAATAIKELKPAVQVIGAEPEAIPRYSESRRQGKPVQVPMKDTIADGLMITKTGENTYPLIQRYVDDTVEVSDDAIVRAMREIVFKAKVLVEPSAAIGVAAILQHPQLVKPDARVCFLLSGGNIDPQRLVSILASGEEVSEARA